MKKSIIGIVLITLLLEILDFRFWLVNTAKI
jgi:hypothetical protein